MFTKNQEYKRRDFHIENLILAHGGSLKGRGQLQEMEDELQTQALDRHSEYPVVVSLLISYFEEMEEEQELVEQQSRVRIPAVSS